MRIFFVTLHCIIRVYITKTNTNNTMRKRILLSLIRIIILKKKLFFKYMMRLKLQRSS